ncbi:MAG TPA: class I SAM-dependent methyltransferase [Aggregatilineaceae bacterium]|nr:class I SAM-dependent methyltransferase [Aggregatilineaceae bacterium]
MTVPNLDRFSGIADVYDQFRPKVPAAFADLLIQLVGTPNLVVDVGCGTGLSTRIWAGRAAQIIGIEPNRDMREEAKRRTMDTKAVPLFSLPHPPLPLPLGKGSQTHRMWRIIFLDRPNIRYQDGIGAKTGLADECADIVTVAQALHWMEPEPTFAEVARILRPGGVFAAIDCDWPPCMNWEAEAAYNACMEQATRLIEERGYVKETRLWDKEGHLGRMEASGHFRYVREVVLHHVEQGNAERLVGVALSQGRVAIALRNGINEDEAGVTALRDVAERTLGNELKPWYFGYRVRLGIK